MRFIGNKENIVDKIYSILLEEKITGDSFFDFFAGTASVGKFFKQKGYQVFSSDILYFSYVLQMAYITNNNKPNFKKLLKNLDLETDKNKTPLNQVIDYLNGIKPISGFIYKNYTPTGTKQLKQPRMYFSDENGKRIDAIRQTIEKWWNDNLLLENEYFILLASLIETVPFYSNTTGVYGAFQKKWDPRALKSFALRMIDLIFNDKNNKSFNKNSIELLDSITIDVLYLDPPYNQRQYAPNYHILETIAKYDNPKIKGVTGLRDYKNQKSNFCNPQNGLEELNKIAKEAKYNSLILSYNSEGIMNKNEIIKTLEQYGNVKLVEFEYKRYKSNSNGISKHKKHVYEQVYILRK